MQALKCVLRVIIACEKIMKTGSIVQKLKVLAIFCRDIYFWSKPVMILSLFCCTTPVFAGVYTANPENYLSQLRILAPGDHLRLLPGEYNQGLPLQSLNGTAQEPIVISGPDSAPHAVFQARSGHNTVSIVNSGYITVRNLELDGRNMPDIDAVKAEGHGQWAHHITLENLIIRNHGGSQQTVGISTKCTAWNWVIRGNIILGAGTGIYLGNSDGSAPFIDGLVENNLVADTLGYNMEIKHQKLRKPVQGMPQASHGTIIRNNVFIKAANASMGANARPNVLVGHFPLEGAGMLDRYYIYGNLFYENATEALFQGEGNLAIYNNLFFNSQGDAINIRPHNDRPRDVYVFFNTIVASGSGLSLRGLTRSDEYDVSANAVFAERNVIGWLKGDPVTAPYSDADNYLVNPFAMIGKLDLYPSNNKLAEHIDTQRYRNFTDWDRDFNGMQRVLDYRGAYAGSGINHGWFPRVERKPQAASHE